MNTPTAERVRRHRQGLRDAGLRLLQIWVPDTRRAGFAAECRRQSLRVGRQPDDADTQRWLEQVADTDGWP